MTLALLVARSGLIDFGYEALPHVNDPRVHIVASCTPPWPRTRLSFVEFLHLGRVPGTLVLVVGILLVFVVGVDDGLGEVNQ